jgi:hypothetical protein
VELKHAPELDHPGSVGAFVDHSPGDARALCLGEVMLRIRMLTIFLIVASVTWPNAASAQDSNEQGQNKQPTPENLFAGLFGDSVQSQLTQMATRIIDGYLDYLAKPETTKKLATFQKNYYDALIEQGFTKEQAFELVLRFGNPLADGPRAGK